MGVALLPIGLRDPMARGLLARPGFARTNETYFSDPTHGRRKRRLARLRRNV